MWTSLLTRSIVQAFEKRPEVCIDTPIGKGAVLFSRAGSAENIFTIVAKFLQQFKDLTWY